MRIKHRIHEWLADRIPWVQYPDGAHMVYERRWPRYRDLSGKQRAWRITGLFWVGVIIFALA